MAIGFILIRTAPGQERAVFKALQDVPEVAEVHPLFGEYDLIAKMEAEDHDLLGHAIVAKVRSIQGIVSTRTLAAGPV